MIRSKIKFPEFNIYIPPPLSPLFSWYNILEIFKFYTLYIAIPPPFEALFWINLRSYKVTLLHRSNRAPPPYYSIAVFPEKIIFFKERCLQSLNYSPAPDLWTLFLYISPFSMVRFAHVANFIPPPVVNPEFSLIIRPFIVIYLQLSISPAPFTI